MVKTPRYRVFDGRKYKFHIRRRERYLADADARKLRKNYQYARVVPDGMYWVVYSCQKVRKDRKGRKK